MEPITLISGKPGHGKTLRAVQILTEAKAEGLTCFHHGINELDPAFAESLDDLTQWATLPAGSVLVVDECQEAGRFPKRPPHQAPPEWIEKLSKVRHFGIRIILLTQDVRNMDHFVRRLAGVHYHLVNTTGKPFAIEHEFRPAVDNPADSRAQKSAQHRVWKYPAKLYGAYKSSTQHMVKSRLPWRVYALPVLVLFALVTGWYGIKAIDRIGGGESAETVAPSAAAPSTAGAANMAALTATNQQARGWATADEFAHAHTPLIAGVPWSAPVFAGMPLTTTPDMLCMRIEHRCRCYTEQLTRLDIDRATCNLAVTRGVYNPYRRTPGQGGGWSASDTAARPGAR